MELIVIFSLLYCWYVRVFKNWDIDISNCSTEIVFFFLFSLPLLKTSFLLQNIALLILSSPLSAPVHGAIEYKHFLFRSIICSAVLIDLTNFVWKLYFCFYIMGRLYIFFLNVWPWVRLFTYPKIIIISNILGFPLPLQQKHTILLYHLSSVSTA